jgi:hypothetical protein
MTLHTKLVVVLRGGLRAPLAANAAAVLGLSLGDRRRDSPSGWRVRQDIRDLEVKLSRNINYVGIAVFSPRNVITKLTKRPSLMSRQQRRAALEEFYSVG